MLKKCNETWDKVKNLFKREFDSKPSYNDKYIKTKIKIYYDKTYTNCLYNKVPKDNECCVWLSAILLDSIDVNTDQNCYPQIILKEYKYVVKQKKIINTINEKLNIDESDI